VSRDPAADPHYLHAARALRLERDVGATCPNTQSHNFGPIRNGRDAAAPLIAHSKQRLKPRKRKEAQARIERRRDVRGKAHHVAQRGCRGSGRKRLRYRQRFGHKRKRIGTCEHEVAHFGTPLTRRVRGEAWCELFGDSLRVLAHGARYLYRGRGAYFATRKVEHRKESCAR
jgi:hypothetical protein